MDYNPAHIKPIETRYKGYRFRSRLEARWAVFFDTLGQPYEYEKEGLDLDGIPYLPDFWLPQQNVWFEVKPDRGAYDIPLAETKAYRLAVATGKHVVLASGDVWPDAQARNKSATLFDADGAHWDHGYLWAQCPICATVTMTLLGYPGDIGCDCPKDDLPIGDRDGDCPIYPPSARIKAAYVAARQARFDAKGGQR